MYLHPNMLCEHDAKINIANKDNPIIVFLVFMVSSFFDFKIIFYLIFCSEDYFTLINFFHFFVASVIWTIITGHIHFMIFPPGSNLPGA